METIVGIAGSGLSMLGVAIGCRMFDKNVKIIHAVALSDYVYKNKRMWYDKFHPLFRFEGLSAPPDTNRAP